MYVITMRVSRRLKKEEKEEEEESFVSIQTIWFRL